MGTNWYLRYDICEHCNRYDYIHIGKKSVGWKFIFRGYQDIPEILIKFGIDGNDLGSVELWKILTKKGKIYSEYGDFIRYDDFWHMVENFQRLKSDIDAGVCSFDGYDFLLREFS